MQPIEITSLLKECRDAQIDEHMSRLFPRTPDCPPLSRFPTAMKDGWTPAEREHVSKCARYCQRLVEIQWRIEHPGLLTVIQYLAGTSPDLTAMRLHLDNGRCALCAFLHQSAIVKTIWKLIELDSTSEMAAAISSEILVGAGDVPAVARAASESTTQFQSRFGSQDGSLVASFRVVPGRDPVLLLQIDNFNKQYAGRTLEIELLMSGRPPIYREATLSTVNEFGAMAAIELGPYRDLADHINQYAVIVRPRNQ